MIEHQSMRVSVRKAEIKDVDVIAAVHVASWTNAYQGLVPNELSSERTLQFRELQWLEAFSHDDAIILVACDEDLSIKGFISASPMKSERSAVYLETLYVAPEAWGERIGSRLLYALAKMLISRKLKALVLRAFYYGRARGFYEYFGARRIADGEAPQTRTEDVVLVFDDLDNLVKRIESLLDPSQ